MPCVVQSQRPRSQCKAAGAAFKKLRIEEDSEDEEAEDGGDAGSDYDPIEDASGEMGWFRNHPAQHAQQEGW